MLGLIDVLLLEVFKEILSYNVKFLVFGELSYFLGILYSSKVLFKRIIEFLKYEVFVEFWFEDVDFVVVKDLFKYVVLFEYVFDN